MWCGMLIYALDKNFQGEGTHKENGRRAKINTKIRI